MTGRRYATMQQLVKYPRKSEDGIAV